MLHIVVLIVLEYILFLCYLYTIFVLSLCHCMLLWSSLCLNISSFFAIFILSFWSSLCLKLSSFCVIFLLSLFYLYVTVCLCYLHDTFVLSLHYLYFFFSSSLCCPCVIFVLLYFYSVCVLLVRSYFMLILC